MKKYLAFLLFLLTIAKSLPVRHEKPGTQSDKYTKYYQNKFKKVQKHFKIAQERSLQQTHSRTNFILPTNMTLINRRRPHLSGLHNFLQGYLGGNINRRFFPRNRNRLTPLFNRFRIRRRSLPQLSCSLSVRVGGMQNFFQIGVVLVRLTFFSSCMPEPYTKFIWTNNFDSSSHFRLRINQMSYLFLFGNIVQRTSQFQGMVHYNSYKLLTLFRAGVFNIRGAPASGKLVKPGRRRRTRPVSKKQRIRERMLKDINVPLKTRKSLKSNLPKNSFEEKKKVIKTTRNKLSGVFNSLVKKERKLIDKITLAKIKTKKSNKNNVQKPGKLEMLPKNTYLSKSSGSKKTVESISQNSKLIPETTLSNDDDRKLKRWNPFRKRRRRGNRRRNKRAQKRKRRSTQRRRPQRPINRAAPIRVHPPAPIRAHQAPPIIVRQAAPIIRPIVNRIEEPSINGQVRRTLSRRRNLQRSFSNLLNRNDESGSVFMRRVNEPVNIFPRIDWRSVGRRREILSSGNNRRPFFRFRTIRKIWRGSNPQIAPSRPIPVLRDSLITVAI